MTTTFPDPGCAERREQIVERHIQAEMAGDLDACLATFDAGVSYDIVPLGVPAVGEDAVRHLLQALIGAFPDLGLHVLRRHHAPDALIIEGRMTGTHLGIYAGIAPTGRTMDLRAAVFFRFEGDRLSNETVYYDELDLRRQLGAAPLEVS